ncbi:MAG TPA: TetR/AcrR family transcriptional regulator [Rhabdaerophilum sp.]|nr:TetR/AcrR family transcriptional regulator [Rhabdaerophilum sp.]
MARPRAADYENKRGSILSEAAKLFAVAGYDRTSMNEIAQALGVSKALFYHYYPSKDALLYAIIRDHLVHLVEMAEKADDPDRQPEARLAAVIDAIFACYRGADAEHKVQINHLSQLPETQQDELKALERRLVTCLSGVVRAVRPDIPRASLRPVTMSLFGILNWKYMWFREGGAMSEAEYSALVTRMAISAIRVA